MAQILWTQLPLVHTLVRRRRIIVVFDGLPKLASLSCETTNGVDLMRHQTTLRLRKSAKTFER